MHNHVFRDPDELWRNEDVRQREREDSMGGDDSDDEGEDPFQVMAGMVSF